MMGFPRTVNGQAEPDLNCEYARVGVASRAHRTVGTEELGDRPRARRVCIAHLCRLGTLLRRDMHVRARGHGGRGSTTAVAPPPPRHGKAVDWEPAAGGGREGRPPRTEGRDGCWTGFVGGVGR